MKNSNVLAIRPSLINAAAAIAYLAQEFMEVGKRFGLFVWGSSGCSKNFQTDKLPTLLTKLHKRMGIERKFAMVDFNLASREPQDVAGLPYIKRDEVQPTTEFAPIYNWTEQGEHGIFRIDEMDRPSDRSIIPAVAKYAIDRTDKHVLPLNWFTLALGNGCTDRDTVELSNHIKGRFLHIYTSINSDAARRDFETYLSQKDAHPAIKALWRLSPCESNDCFVEHAQYQPRTMGSFADAILKAYDKYGATLKALGCPVDEVLRPMLAGCVGVAMANELFRLMEFAALPSLGEIVNQPSKVAVPADLSLAVKYVSTLCDFVSNEVEAKGLATYIKRFPAEITRMGLEKLASLWNCIPMPTAN